MRLAIVTASTDLQRSRACVQSWGVIDTICVLNGTSDLQTPTPSSDLTIIHAGRYLGTVPAFQAGVDYALDHTDAEIIACFHDDLELQDAGWAEKVIRHFETHPRCGLAGFGGAIGLGRDDIYQAPYTPMQLARIGFRSNLVDAEVHGVRSLLAEQVACLDGFSQIGRREFWVGNGLRPNLANASNPERYGGLRGWDRPLTYLAEHGMIHHFYDGALGALAARHGWETWYLPIRCRHYGGQTAVGDAGYQAWAKDQIPGGDQGFWEQSHRRGYDLFGDVLPLRV